MTNASKGYKELKPPLSSAERAFLAVLREDSVEDDVCRATRHLNLADWEALFRLAVKTELSPIFYARASGLKIKNIPREISLKFKALSFSNLTRNLVLEQELINILAYLKSESIPVIPLKGPALARFLYNDLALRQSSVDLDLLVEHSRVKEAVKKLKGINFVSGLNDDKEEFFYKHRRQIMLAGKTGKRTTAVELHWDFRDGFTDTHLNYFWRNARYIHLDGYQALAPANEDLLLFLVLTAMSDFDFIQIKYIYDIHRFIRLFGSRTDWDTAVSRAEEISLSSAFFFALALSRALFSTDVPEEALSCARPSFLKRNVLGFWINAGNALRSRERIAPTYLWRHFLSSYLLSANIFDCAKITSRKIFLPMEAVMFYYGQPLSRVSYLLYVKRLLKPILWKPHIQI